jgi:hypothetical protein
MASHFISYFFILTSQFFIQRNHMPRVQCTRSVEIVRTPRVRQLEGMFDVPPQERSERRWEVDLPLEERDWQIGLIVGPSGCGKTTLARELFPDALAAGFEWPAGKSIVDAFPATLRIKEVVGLLSSVGFSSPPSWLRPFRALSNGEQFRVTIARVLAELALPERPELAVIDEFTSVVDRTVARIGSAAIAKTIRRVEKPGNKRRLVAISCHYDIIDWLDPDWVYDPASDEFQWRRLRQHEREEASDTQATVKIASRNQQINSQKACLFARPNITLEIARVHRKAWQLFKQHHYLNTNLNPAAKCFVAFVVERREEGKPGMSDLQDCDSHLDDRPASSLPLDDTQLHPAAFTAVLSAPDSRGGYWREHRTVCLPDFQGVGIGNALSEFVASLFVATGKRYCSRTSHPAMIGHWAKSQLWKMAGGVAFGRKHTGQCAAFNHSAALARLTAGFRYIGPANEEAAKALGIVRSV